MTWVRRAGARFLDVEDDSFVGVIGTPPALLRRMSHLFSQLTPSELVRAEAFKDRRDADSYVGAHLLAREVAAEAAGCSVEEVAIEQRCDECGASDHGRPLVVGPAADLAPGLAVSWSHSRVHVLAAAGTGPLGVDVESLDATVPRSRRVLTEDELTHVASAAKPAVEAVRLWTRKEALVKVGKLRLDDLGRADVRAEAPVFDLPASSGLSTAQQDDARLASVVGEGWVAAFARLRRHRGPSFAQSRNG